MGAEPDLKGAIIMTIGQVAQSQQMLYNIAKNNVSSYSSTSASSSLSSSKLSAYSGLLYGWGSSTDDTGDNFFSTPAALKGTVRQIAKRLYDASFSSDATAAENMAGLTQGANTAGGDPTLQAIRKQLGTKVDSLQQLYQPDQTSLTDNFAQLQAVAESLVSRLQTVTLSDETTKKIQNLALMDAKNSAGMREDGKASNTTALSRADRISMIQKEVQKFAPSKRAAAFNTINKVWENEMDRIGAYIKEKDPNWAAWGDEFDAGILDDYKAGVNMWI